MTKLSKKIISIFVIACFVMTQNVVASPGVGIDILPQRETPSALQIDIPVDLATLDGLYEAPARSDSKLILHIQNAHANYSAQIKIKELLEYLEKTYAFKTIFVEGASEDLNPDYLRMFPDKERNARLAQFLAEQGELTGAELYLLETDDKKIEGKGIEKAELYRENYEALQKVFGSEATVNKYLGGFEARLETLSSKVFSSDLRKLLAEWRKFEKGHREFMPYIRTLTVDAKKILGIDLESLLAQIEWPQIARLLVLQGMEKDLSVQKAELEKELLVQFLKDKKVSGKLVAAIRDFQGQRVTVLQGDTGSTGLLHPRDLMEQLVMEAGPKGFRFADYPEFSLYAGYLILKNELDPKSLFEEIKVLFARILDKLAVNTTQKTLLDLFRDEELVRKLLNLELTRKDWRAVGEKKEMLGMDALVGRLKEIGIKVSGEFNVPLSNFETKPVNSRFRQDVKEIEAAAHGFYEAARKREDVFYEKIDSVMTKGSLNKAVLITGGFHTDGITDLLREHEISYGVLTPRLSEKSDEKLYRSVMLQNKPRTFELSYLDKTSFLQSLAGQGKMLGERRLFGTLGTILRGIGYGGKFGSVGDAISLFNQSFLARSAGIMIDSNPKIIKGKPHYQIVRRVSQAPVVVAEKQLEVFEKASSEPPNALDEAMGRAIEDQIQRVEPESGVADPGLMKGLKDRYGYLMRRVLMPMVLALFLTPLFAWAGPGASLAGGKFSAGARAFSVTYNEPEPGMTEKGEEFGPWVAYEGPWFKAKVGYSEGSLKYTWEDRVDENPNSFLTAEAFLTRHFLPTKGVPVTLSTGLEYTKLTDELEDYKRIWDQYFWSIEGGLGPFDLGKGWDVSVSGRYKHLLVGNGDSGGTALVQRRGSGIEVSTKFQKGGFFFGPSLEILNIEKSEEEVEGEYGIYEPANSFRRFKVEVGYEHKFGATGRRQEVRSETRVDQSARFESKEEEKEKNVFQLQVPQIPYLRVGPVLRNPDQNEMRTQMLGAKNHFFDSNDELYRFERIKKSAEASLERINAMHAMFAVLFSGGFTLLALIPISKSINLETALVGPFFLFIFMSISVTIQTFFAVVPHLKVPELVTGMRLAVGSVLNFPGLVIEKITNSVVFLLNLSIRIIFGVAQVTVLGAYLGAWLVHQFSMFYANLRMSQIEKRFFPLLSKTGRVGEQAALILSVIFYPLWRAAYRAWGFLGSFKVPARYARFKSYFDVERRNILKEFFNNLNFGRRSRSRAPVITGFSRARPTSLSALENAWDLFLEDLKLPVIQIEDASVKQLLEIDLAMFDKAKAVSAFLMGMINDFSPDLLELLRKSPKPMKFEFFYDSSPKAPAGVAFQTETGDIGINIAKIELKGWVRHEKEVARVLRHEIFHQLENYGLLTPVEQIQFMRLAGFEGVIRGFDEISEPVKKVSRRQYRYIRLSELAESIGLDENSLNIDASKRPLTDKIKMWGWDSSGPSPVSEGSTSEFMSYIEKLFQETGYGRWVFKGPDGPAINTSSSMFLQNTEDRPFNYAKSMGIAVHDWGLEIPYDVYKRFTPSEYLARYSEKKFSPDTPDDQKEVNEAERFLSRIIDGILSDTESRDFKAMAEERLKQQLGKASVSESVKTAEVLEDKGQQKARTLSGVLDEQKRFENMLSALERNGKLTPEEAEKLLRVAEIAREAHEGQLRKNSRRPYIVHPLDVARRAVEDFGMTDFLGLIIALLHDVREDQYDRYENVLKKIQEIGVSAKDMLLVRRGVLMLSNLLSEEDRMLYGRAGISGNDALRKRYYAQFIQPELDLRVAKEGLDDSELDIERIRKIALIVKFSDLASNTSDLIPTYREINPESIYRPAGTPFSEYFIEKTMQIAIPELVLPAVKAQLVSSGMVNQLFDDFKTAFEAGITAQNSVLRDASRKGLAQLKKVRSETRTAQDSFLDTTKDIEGVRVGDAGAWERVQNAFGFLREMFAAQTFTDEERMGIEYQRFVNREDAAKARIRVEQGELKKPQDYYGGEEMQHWYEAMTLVESMEKDPGKATPELLKLMHSKAYLNTPQTYYEYRRIQLAFDRGEITPAQRDDALAGLLRYEGIKNEFKSGKINEAERNQRMEEESIRSGIYWSVIRQGRPWQEGPAAHNQLIGKFRSDPLDELQYVHSNTITIEGINQADLITAGPVFTIDELKKLTQNEKFGEIGEDGAVNFENLNPLLDIRQGTIHPYRGSNRLLYSKAAGGRYDGEAFHAVIFYTPVPKVDSAVRGAFQSFQQKFASLQSADPERKNITAWIDLIVELQRHIVMIHPFLDGNGRSSRFLTDFLFGVIGLPPPLYPNEQDLVGSAEDSREFALKAMEAYLAAYRNLLITRGKTALPEDTLKIPSRARVSVDPARQKGTEKGHDQFPTNPTVTTLVIAKTMDGKLILTRRDGTWALAERYVLGGESASDTAVAALTDPDVGLGLNPQDVRVGEIVAFESKPFRSSSLYRYSAVVEAQVSGVPSHVEAMDPAMLDLEEVFPEHREILRKYLSGEDLLARNQSDGLVNIRDYKKRTAVEKPAEPQKAEATQRAHDKIRANGFVQPVVASDTVIEYYDQDGNFQGVVLVERKTDGHLATPGGFARQSEAAEYNAARENFEETGLSDIKLERLLRIATRGNRDERSFIWSPLFLARVQGRRPTAGDDAKSIRIFKSRAELEQYILDPKSWVRADHPADVLAPAEEDLLEQVRLQRAKDGKIHHGNMLKLQLLMENRRHTGKFGVLWADHLEHLETYFNHKEEQARKTEQYAAAVNLEPTRVILALDQIMPVTKDGKERDLDYDILRSLKDLIHQGVRVVVIGGENQRAAFDKIFREIGAFDSLEASKKASLNELFSFEEKGGFASRSYDRRTVNLSGSANQSGTVGAQLFPRHRYMDRSAESDITTLLGFLKWLDYSRRFKMMSGKEKPGFDYEKARILFEGGD